LQVVFICSFHVLLFARPVSLKRKCLFVAVRWVIRVQLDKENLEQNAITLLHIPNLFKVLLVRLFTKRTNLIPGIVHKLVRLMHFVWQYYVQNCCTPIQKLSHMFL